MDSDVIFSIYCKTAVEWQQLTLKRGKVGQWSYFPWKGHTCIWWLSTVNDQTSFPNCECKHLEVLNLCLKNKGKRTKLFWLLTVCQNLLWWSWWSWWLWWCWWPMLLVRLSEALPNSPICVLKSLFYAPICSSCFTSITYNLSHELFSWGARVLPKASPSVGSFPGVDTGVTDRWNGIPALQRRAKPPHVCSL